jgi:hypothetical protein
MAFIAMLGVVRVHDDSSGVNGEFAILLPLRLKGYSLGWLMMKHMIAHGKGCGLKTIDGQVLAENSTMLTMCAELGFRVADDVERGVKHVTLNLEKAG